MFNVLFIFPYRFYYIESIMTYGNLPSLSESSNSNTYMMPIANIQSPQGSIDNNNNNSNNLKQSTAMTFVQKISNLEGKSVLAKLEEMEKCMDYLQQQLKEHAGCINEIDFSFPSQKRSQGLRVYFYHAIRLLIIQFFLIV